MTKYKVIHERDKCVGCGACVSICPRLWRMGEDGLAELKNGEREGGKFKLEIETLSCAKNSAEVCPVNCIHIIDMESEEELI